MTKWPANQRQSYLRSWTFSVFSCVWFWSEIIFFSASFSLDMTPMTISREKKTAEKKQRKQHSHKALSKFEIWLSLLSLDQALVLPEPWIYDSHSQQFFRTWGQARTSTYQKTANNYNLAEMMKFLHTTVHISTIIYISRRWTGWESAEHAPSTSPNSCWGLPAQVVDLAWWAANPLGDKKNAGFSVDGHLPKKCIYRFI